MFKLFGFNKKRVVVNKINKVDEYVSDIEKMVNNDTVMNVVVFLIQEDEQTAYEIANKLNRIGYRLTIRKHNNSYEFGIFV